MDQKSGEQRGTFKWYFKIYVDLYIDSILLAFEAKKDIYPKGKINTARKWYEYLVLF